MRKFKAIDEIVKTFIKEEDEISMLIIFESKMKNIKGNKHF
jgi:hypothetical protein